MLIFREIAGLRYFLDSKKKEAKTLGFVPTMGALHPGHVSLIALSKQQCDFTVCSIFVNPTQFNDKKDLERYPRMPEKDIELLEKAGCDVLFMPSVEEIYPSPIKETFAFGYLNTTLEGNYRPGHFDGVAQVVKRFFQIVEPDKAFFGSKDYQQVMIIKALVKLMHSPIEIVSCPILREPDGLAMSSRNALLTADERNAAKLLPAILQEANGIILTKGIAAAREFVQQQTAANPLLRLEYYEVCEADTLEIVSGLRTSRAHVALIACFAGRIRLIDNLPVG